MKLLIVEDNAKMRAMIRSIVEPHCSAVHECEDGDEAVALYSRLLPDWVLMDIKLGRMDGIAATRAIKSAFPNAQIVMVTAFNSERLRRGALQAGATAYVLKENILDILKAINASRVQ